MPDTGSQPHLGQSVDDAAPRRGPGPRWWSSAWLWPAVAIGLSSVTGTLFGSIGVILTAEALAALIITGVTLLLSRDRWQTFGLAVALLASLLLFISSISRHESRQGNTPFPTSIMAQSSAQPVDWQHRRISQGTADEADFRGADLDDANLNGLQLSHKNFDGVQADGASFQGSQLEYASLRGASLRGACLQGADLTGADLTGADLTGADVAGVTVSRQARQSALAWPATPQQPAAACSQR
jgi:hypothetical protein